MTEIMRNPRDGAGYDTQGRLLVPAERGLALSHYCPGRHLTWEDRICTPGWTHEPELEPWPDCPLDKIRDHSELCDWHRKEGGAAGSPR